MILVGERAATTPGLLSAVAALATSTGAKLAWVPRRAGERGALEAGLLPNQLPGGRPLSDAAARVDVGATWGTTMPATQGRDTAGILAAAASGELAALVLGGLEVDDLEDPSAARTALQAVGFLVSLEVRASVVTALADVVLPVAPMAERSGSFVNWEGRVRPFDQVIDSSALTDTRVLAGISEELGAPLGFRSTDEARREMTELGPWDGEHPAFTPVKKLSVTGVPDGQFVVATWRTLIDDSRAVDGEPYLQATGRAPTAVVSPAALTRLGLSAGDQVIVSTDAGQVSLPIAVGDIADDVVWMPSNSAGINLRRDLGASAGSTVALRGGA